ncbi:MAG TPA: hypothetical protein PKW42_09715, partial [bacterium]|nr:hypothetical protein [bacterium]
ATQLLSFQVWGAKPENVAVCLPRLFLHVFTRDPGPKDPVPAHRPFVVYLDDLKIEGEVPEPKEEFEKEAVRRWAPVAEKTKKKIGEWEEIIAQAEKDLASLPVVSGEAAVLKAALEKEMKARDVRRLPEIQEAKKTGMLSQATYDKLAPFYTRLRNGQYLANIKTLSQPERVSQIKSTGMLIYTVNPTSNPAEWVLPGTVLVPGEISNNLKITACPGEYEPGSFVVRAISDMKGLEIQPGELVGSGGKIPSSAVDIKVVKCWYQDEDGRRLVPELLLNDDSLVKVDEEAKISRIKFKVGEETKYLCYEDAEWADFTKGKIKVANDAGRLLPVDIPAGTSKQFWVTVRVPEEARAGTYQGKLCLISGGKSLAEMNLSLQVLPFKLSLPYYQVSIWGGTDRNEARYINIVKNQLAHGVTVPFHSLSGGSDRLVQLEKTLKIWRDLGVTTDLWMAPGELVYSLLAGGKSHKGLTRIEVTEEQKKRYQEEFQKYAELGKKYGMKEIYFYLADERDAAELEAWLPVFEIVRAAGGKVMNGTNIGKTFEITGGKIDIFGCSTGVSRR